MQTRDRVLIGILAPWYLLLVGYYIYQDGVSSFASLFSIVPFVALGWFIGRRKQAQLAEAPLPQSSTDSLKRTMMILAFVVAIVATIVIVLTSVLPQ
ncbi:MAG: hypothetical protein ACYCZ0_03260 [Minisyncoccota bacterium]